MGDITGDWCLYLPESAFHFLRDSKSTKLFINYSQMNHSSKVHDKVRWQLLHIVTAFFITKCDNLLLQSATAILLQSVTSVITKYDGYYKVRRFYYKVRQVLQSATIITKCDSVNAA